MPQTFPYHVLDVFTSTPFTGNQLAVVLIPSATALTPAQKQTIAKEFNFAETTFVSRVDAPGQVYDVAIYTPLRELAFAGHPVIGTGKWVLDKEGVSEATFRIKAGDLVVTKGQDGKVRAKVPVNFKNHGVVGIESAAEYNNKDVFMGKELVSIVKGMTFCLVEVHKDRLHEAENFNIKPLVESVDLGEWRGGGFVGVYVYAIDKNGSDDGVWHVQTRMFADGIEDAATGSAASSLAAFFATTSKKSVEVNIVQGEDMGRRSELFVDAAYEEGNISELFLRGEAVEVMEGKLFF